MTFPRLLLFAAFSTLSASFALASGQWIPPSAEELAMTSIPQVPGAPAVVLYKEQVTEDSMRMFSYYSRIKVLTEGGKEYANVELPFGGNASMSVDNLSGRTIHADGTIIPFTGKPYEKMVAKIDGYKYKEKIFTLPSVEVGSIIEYRYKLHYDDGYFFHPDWFVQSDLFIKKAHYLWKPNSSSREQINDSRGNVLDRVAWTPILPAGDKVEQASINGQSNLTLDVADVMPVPKEEFMPPIGSFSYRVLFYYTAYRNSTEFWDKEGKRWSEARDKYIGPGKGVKNAVASLVSPGDTPDQKLRKIYANVMTFENTDFTRERSTQEEKAAGFKVASSTDDILAHKRGNGDQLTDLFVGMARAAGVKAYLMAVSDRKERIFYPPYLSFGQLDDYIAIVNVDGKDMYFDPGQRYCAYGQMSWRHQLSGGLRQTEGGVALASVPGSSYKDSRVSRIGDLALDEHGAATGSVTLTYTGDPALRWRQQALRGDDTSLNADLKEHLEQMMPGGMEVRVTKVDNLTDAEQPLKITYEVKGPIGSSTGKRLLVPANLFEANSKPKFPQAKREVAIDMHYPSYAQDAVRFKLPDGVAIESAPTAELDKTTDGTAIFEIKSAQSKGSITLYRNVIFNRTIFLPSDYTNLRAFYGKLEAKDQETVILTHAPAPASSGTN